MTLQRSIAFLSTFIAMRQTIKLGVVFFSQALPRKAK